MRIEIGVLLTVTGPKSVYIDEEIRYIIDDKAYYTLGSLKFDYWYPASFKLPELQKAWDNQRGK